MNGLISFHSLFPCKRNGKVSKKSYCVLSPQTSGCHPSRIQGLTGLVETGLKLGCGFCLKYTLLTKGKHVISLITQTMITEVYPYQELPLCSDIRALQ